MEKIAVFMDQAEHACRLLQPMLFEAAPTFCVLVACPPRLSRRIGKWVSHTNREQWRAKWSAKLFEQVEPLFHSLPNCRIETLIATGPLDAVSVALRTRLGAPLQVLDARRPKIGDVLEPVTGTQPLPHGTPWASPIAVASGICTMLALAD